MNVHILLEWVDQSEFTGEDRVSMAEPACCVVDVFTDLSKANEEKERLTAALDPNKDSDTFYSIETRQVQG